jgi:hypothetical protein
MDWKRPSIKSTGEGDYNAQLENVGIVDVWSVFIAISTASRLL